MSEFRTASQMARRAREQCLEAIETEFHEAIKYIRDELYETAYGMQRIHNHPAGQVTRVFPKWIAGVGNPKPVVDRFESLGFTVEVHNFDNVEAETDHIKLWHNINYARDNEGNNPYITVKWSCKDDTGTDD